MPRHRIETQRSRTLWPAAGQTARRVPVRAAGRRPKPSHAKEAVAPEWRLRLARNQRRMLKRAGRRLLVSPWFAAGAGVVIATAAIVVVPHDMSFQGAIRIHHCKQLGCTVVSPEGVAGAKPAGTGLQLTPSPSSTSPLTGMTFSYQVLDQNQFGFIMQMTIRSRHSLGDWKLSFVIRGAREVFVLGARWQQSGTNGGTASNYIGVTESVGYSSISGKNSDGVGSSQNGYTVQFQVHGTGAPSTPVECSYDGYACTFQSSHSQVGAS